METLEMKSVDTALDINIGLNKEKRKTITKRLTQLLADEQILYTKLRNYHWNIMGIHFNSLHAFFEEQYTALFTITDEIAERIRSLGFYSVGSMQAFLENARLKESPNLNGDGMEMLKHILADHAAIIRTLRDDIKVTADLEDEGTTDFLIGLMANHEKLAWMVRSHIG